MGVAVTENVTTVTATGGVTVDITENTTSVSVSDNTATLTIAPSETSVSVTGNTTAINVTSTDTSVNVTSDSIGTSGSQTLFGNLTIESRGALSNVLYEHLTFKHEDTAVQIAGKINAITNTNAPAGLCIGVNKGAIKFFDGFNQRSISPCDVDTGSTTDNIVKVGNSFSRFAIGYFASGIATSSDRNEKKDIEQLNEAELRVATKCKTLLRKYRRTEAIAEKGVNARIHFGIIAQDLKDAFTSEGLDAHRYAMFMSDTWYETEENGIAYPSLNDVQEDLREIAVEKTRLGIRYEQLLAFIIAAL